MIKSLKNCVLLFLLLVIFISCSEKKEIIRYANGNIKLEAELKNGIRHGKLVDYYEDGSIKSRSIWKNGVVEGKVEHYFANGKFKEVTYYETGKANGTSKQYYENGQLFKEATYKNDRIVGEINFYHDNGALKEKRIHDEDGGEMYRANYNKNNNMIFEAFLPRPIYKPDTLSYGELYQIQLKFGIKPRYKTQLLTGIFDDQHMLIDTTAIIEPNADDIYTYSFKPIKQGKDSLFIMVSHLGVEKDSLIVNGIIVYHNYFIKP
ncbi:toxin-antitoxin system YwqK family antitoxin [Rhodocytophaga rosea]|uniref:Toxin-antitoxin system YwqK family antitoxin n=1 Tax=Rhodocytophaga rosea TaxID=2704465 RepID=A0A6C0GMC4_9BACT|nr:toxin-antitoxin system YwqK family antitoxin [Rhodocytophaga rosea]QHT69169.1 toxin-antitoxin system YwqK family antitoxin [Rhodocytophaga rosea]